MRSHLLGIAGMVLALAGTGCARVGSTAYAEVPAPAAAVPPKDIPACLHALEVAQGRLHAATTTEARRDAQLHLQDAQNQLIELQAAQRHEAMLREFARLRRHQPAPTPARPKLETANGSLEHVDAQQIILGHAGGQQLQIDTDGMTEVRLDGQRVKLQELPPGSDVRAAFEPGSTPPVARTIDARRAADPSKSAPR